MKPRPALNLMVFGRLAHMYFYGLLDLQKGRQNVFLIITYNSYICGGWYVIHIFYKLFQLQFIPLHT